MFSQDPEVMDWNLGKAEFGVGVCGAGEIIRRDKWQIINSSPKEVMFSVALVCLSVTNITQKVIGSQILVVIHVTIVRIRIRIRIYLLARRNLLWDILRLPSSRRAALGLYVILTL